MNKHSELEIFKLCERLAELLGDEEAIADLKYLYNRHPEMFTDMQDISNTINNIVTNPDIIKKNPKAKNDKDYMAAKILNDKKMGDIGVRNNNGTNIIFHANKKNINRMKQFQKQILVETPSAKAAPTRFDHCASNSNESPKCDKAPSISVITIVSHNVKYDENDCKKSKNKNIELER